MKERMTPKLSPHNTNENAEPEKASVSGANPAAPDTRGPSKAAGSGVVQWGLLVFAVAGIVGFGFHTLELSERLERLEQSVSTWETRNTNADDSSARISTAMSALTERLAAVENKQDAIAASVSTAATQTDLQAAVETVETRLRALKDRVSAATATQQTTATKPAPAVRPTWVIHLATLSDVGAAEKFVARAKDLGIEIQREDVTVNERPMYRMSIVNIASYDQAEKLAARAQQQLRLAQKPWIAEQ